MHEPIENRIGERGVLQPRVPVFERQLAGDHSRARTDTIIKYLKQIIARRLVEILQAQSSRISTSIFASCASRRVKLPSPCAIFSSSNSRATRT